MTDVSAIKSKHIIFCFDANFSNNPNIFVAFYKNNSVKICINDI